MSIRGGRQDSLKQPLPAATPASAAMVMSVTGLIPTTRLGLTLPHEHLFSSLGEAPGQKLYDYELARAEVGDAATVGTRAIVDATPADLGRRPDLLNRLSRDTGVNIIMGSGFYTYPYMPERVRFQSFRSLSDDLIEDIETGAQGVRPGIIGEVGAFQADIEAREERVLRAVARAHAATGLPIWLHQPRAATGLSMVDLMLEEESALAPGSIVFCHMDSIPDREYHLTVAEAGYWLAYDRLQGWELIHQLSDWEVDRRLDLLKWAKAQGLLARILVSTDCCVLGDLSRFGGPGYKFTHGLFARRLLDSGFTDSDLELIFSINPAAALSIRRSD